jgi:hypothetical protein
MTTNGFNNRVTTAASHMSSGRSITRNLDNCFENFDGDAVALALYLRTLKNPNTKLAANIWKYLSEDMCMSMMDKYTQRTMSELRALSLQITDDAKRLY